MNAHEMNRDTTNFLASLLFTHEELDGKTVFDFHPEFIEAVSGFIQKFRVYLTKRGFDINRLDECRRSFGGNVYFSLSGHGCGFWDEGTELGGALQTHLEAFSGAKYRFEGLNLSTHRKGKLDLSFLVKYLPERRAKMFSEGLSE